MPSVEQFLTAFGLVKGAQADGYILSSATGRESVVSRYHHYTFTFEIVFTKGTTNNINPQELINIMWNVTQGKSLQVMAIKNYYACTFQPFTIEDISATTGEEKVMFKLKGNGVR